MNLGEGKEVREEKRETICREREIEKVMMGVRIINLREGKKKEMESKGN